MNSYNYYNNYISLVLIPKFKDNRERKIACIPQFLKALLIIIGFKS